MAMDKKDKIFQIELPSNIKTNTNKRIDSTPTDEELRIIKEKYYKGATKDNIKVFEVSCGNIISDRVSDAFSDTSIDTMIKTGIGAPFLEDHDITKCVGKIFDMYAKNVDYEDNNGVVYKDIKTAFAKIYIPIEDKYKNIITDIETGVKDFISPGFTIKGAKCSICGKDYSECREHFKGEIYNGQLCSAILEVKELHEVSVVYKGCQYGTRIEKIYGGEDMELKELQAKFETVEKEFSEYKEKYSEKSFNELNANVEELNKKINDLTASNTSLTELVKVFGEDVSAEDLKTVKANAEIGKSAKEETISEIKRLKALVDAARGISSTFDMTKFLDNAEYSYLKEFEKSLVEEAKVIPVGKQTETSDVEDVEETKNLWK